jgi:hypothetical protein
MSETGDCILMPLHQQHIEQQIRILQGVPGSDFPGDDEPEERSWAWVLYPLGILALLAFIYACTQAYVALDEIVTPATTARFHYDMAVAYLATRVAMRSALSDLYATVKGECPSLLNEDSGGDARLDMACRESLGMSPSAKVHPIARCMMDMHDRTIANLEGK